MLKLLIADDEKIIRKGIETSLEWASYQIEIAGTARNGLEALQLAQQVKPDIVITDVRMPLMDGITLSGKLRELDNEVKIIFISGFSDLEYLKSAFKHDAVDYILKPIDISELERSVRKAANRRGKEKGQNVYRQQLEQKLLQSMPFLREKFMKLLVCGEITERREAMERLDFLGIDIPAEGLFIVIIVSIDNYHEKILSLPQLEKQLLEFSILNVVQEMLDAYARGYAFAWGNGRFICVVSLPAGELPAEECIENISLGIHRKLGGCLNLSNTLGIGRWVEDILRLDYSLQHAESALERRFLLGNNRIIYMSGQTEEMTEGNVIRNSFFDSFSLALLNGDKEKAHQLIAGVFEQICSVPAPGDKYVRSICLQMASVISGNASRIKGMGEEKAGDIYYLSEEILKKETIGEMEQFLLWAAGKICSLLSLRRERHSACVVQEIKQMIRRRYMEELSVGSIAREVYLTPAYICMLFKQETGQTVNEYLTSVRIENAKALLKTSGYKLIEISAMVGYSDQKYFSKLFKKHTGVNPSDFREDH